MEQLAEAFSHGRIGSVLRAARARPTECGLHGPSSHRPKFLGLHVHHIWPLGMGGPTIPENTIAVCPTGHDNIHRIIAMLERGEKVRGGHAERIVAAAGHRAWVEAGRPGGRVTTAQE